MLVKLSFIAVGASFGAIVRFGLVIVGKNLAELWHFPAGTLIANLIGCLMIGFLGELGIIKQVFPPNVEAMIFTGFIGSLTTFSTFSHETVKMFNSGSRYHAFAYMFGSVLAGITMVIVGMAMASYIFKNKY